MTKNYSSIIAVRLSISEAQVKSVIALLAEGSTIPFISRYRKEKTGGLDEVQIADMQELHKEILELENRREYILKAIEKQGELTEELKGKIVKAVDLNELEDLYLPYKKKKKTRAERARLLGLEPLSKKIFEQFEQHKINLHEFAKGFLTDEVIDVEFALAGARDIIAEWINEDIETRSQMRDLFESRAVIRSKVIKSKKKEASKFKDYFDSEEVLSKCPSHRLLAMRRGESEGFLRVSISPPSSKKTNPLLILTKKFISGRNESADQVMLAIEDCYKRLLGKSIEKEFAKLSKDIADEKAIDVFTVNLRQLLLAAPLGKKRILAIDPGFRTGCKVVVLNEQGDLLENTVIYLIGNSAEKVKAEAKEKILSLTSKYKTQAVAIGNGTASRETEAFVRSLDMDSSIDSSVGIFVVSEDGASIYSASEIAREEFPDHDVTVRGAVSIGRRLLDPLSELVKIDPKSIGIGQYQHDVDPSKLKHSLDRTIENSVNLVGVNLNTASKSILIYVSGLGPVLAQNIVDYRRKHGEFKSRVEIKKVPKLGKKAFEQCAGFLRILNPKKPLDNSSVHPESYHIVEKMAKDLDATVPELIGNGATIDKIKIAQYVTEDVGIPTLEDIIEELRKPGLDPRGEVEAFSFKDGINEIKDLEEGMLLPGIITNVTNFGAFVDVGVHCDGLVHISQLSNQYVSNPADVISLHQKVQVKVMEIDIERKRIGLSMKDQM